MGDGKKLGVHFGQGVIKCRVLKQLTLNFTVDNLLIILC